MRNIKSYGKYLFIAFVMIAIHLLLTSWMLVALWCLLGFTAAQIGFKRERFFPLKILVIEIIISLLFWVFYFRTDEVVIQLADNSTLSSAEWTGLIILVNIVTAFLCITTFYYFSKIIVVRKKQKSIMETVPMINESNAGKVELTGRLAN